MIVMVLRGGLGNQMYEYASAKAMALRAGTQLVLNTTIGFATDTVYKRKYCLDCFNIKYLCHKILSFDVLGGHYLESISRKVGFHILVPWYKVLYDYDADINDMKARPNRYKRVLMQGTWNRNDDFFDDFKNEIIKDFQLQWELPDLVKHYYDKIKNANKPVVALGIRVFQDVKVKRLDGRQSPPESSYIVNAMDWYLDNVGDVKFMVFTQVPQWLYDNVSTEKYDIEIVDTRGDDTTAVFDMFLFSQCDHYILTNSTFYAWGEKLNIKKNKYVLIPQNWSLSFEDGWIRV